MNETGHPLGDTVDVYLRGDDAERDLEGIVRDEPDWEPFFEVVEVGLDAGGMN
jgi:hypothetical protein